MKDSFTRFSMSSSRTILSKGFLAALALFIFFADPSPAQDKGWEAEWKQSLAAARKEGKVVVTTSPDPVMRNEIVPVFSSRFGISVEFLGTNSTQMAARLRTEREAGVYTVDVVMPSIGNAATILYAEKALQPLKPLLLLPEVTDPSKWKKGRVWFVDPEQRYVLRVFSSVSDLLFVHADLVKPEELRAVKDLLNPKWKGKISTEDPAAGGAATSQAARFFRELGEDFIKKLYFDQKPAVSRDRRQVADWLGRGTYPICLSCREEDVRALQKEGFNLRQIFTMEGLQDELSAAPWVLVVPKNIPHPNAARVFINWILSREGLEAYSRGSGYATLRTDVDQSFLRPEIVPKDGVNYFDNAEWSWVVSGRDELRSQLAKVLKGR